MTTVQREIKQTRPFVDTPAEAVVALMRTADLVRRMLTAVIDPWDVTLQQYNVLRILRGAGEKGLPTLDIADRMVEETPGITRLIDRLEAKELVRRDRCPTDRRQVFCVITKKGLKLLAGIDEPLRTASDAAFEELPSGQIDVLIRLLDRARESLRESINTQRALNEEQRSSAANTNVK